MLRLKNAAFPQFKNPISLEIGTAEKWAVLGPKRREALDVFAGRVPSNPPQALTYPSFGHDVWPSHAIALVRFGQSISSTKAPFLSARYESFRDQEVDLTLGDVYLQRCPDEARARDAAKHLRLTEFWDRWFATLSNGQSRRAQIGLALLKQPRFVIVDEPFLGLDPSNRHLLSDILGNLGVPVALGLRHTGEVPHWVTHLAWATSEGIESGERHEIGPKIARFEQELRDEAPLASTRLRKLGGPVIELKGVTVAYRGRPVFENLEATIREHERVHIRGANGSGKSTLLALLTADHPQSWNEKVVLFGEPREVGKHSFFSIQKLIGHSSPEIHALVPPSMSLLRVILTGYTSSFVPPRQPSREQLDRAESIAASLRIKDSLDIEFGQTNLATQKLLLYARALVRDPPILILDEAFSTLSPEQLLVAFSVLDDYKGTVLIVGHVESEIPPCDSEITLG